TGEGDDPRSGPHRDGRRPPRLRHRGRSPGGPEDDPRARRCDQPRGGGGGRAAARPGGRRPRRAAPMRRFAGIFAVTFAGLLAVGAVLPVLPRYVHGPLDGGNVAVGIVGGSYPATGLLLRPVAGRVADRRGPAP